MHPSFLPSFQYPTYNADRVAQTGRGVARIHRQKEKKEAFHFGLDLCLVQED